MDSDELTTLVQFRNVLLSANDETGYLEPDIMQTRIAIDRLMAKTATDERDWH